MFAQIAAQPDVALVDRRFQLAIATFGTEPLELIMEVEHQSLGREPPGRPTGVRMEPNDIIGLAAEADCETRVIRVPRDPRIGSKAHRGVDLAQGLQARP